MKANMRISPEWASCAIQGIRPVSESNLGMKTLPSSRRDFSPRGENVIDESFMLLEPGLLPNKECL